jgi:hypothetical protein
MARMLRTFNYAGLRPHRVVLLVVLLSLVSSWCMVRRHRVAAQEAALARLGRVLMHEPLWDLDGRIRDVWLKSRVSLSDDDLQSLGQLVYLRSLSVDHGDFTDAGLAALEGLDRLETLMISKEDASEFRPAKYAPLTDAGLSHVSGLTRLRWLSYVGARVTDAGLRYVEGLQNLESLMLDCPKATDQGLSSLACLDRLERLSLFNGKKMTGEGLVALPSPEKLTELKLSNIDDAGMRTITRFANLRKLDIGAASVTADGFRKIRKLKRLEELCIKNSSLDKQAIQESVGRLQQIKRVEISGGRADE